MTTEIQLLTIADWEAMPHGDGNIYEIIEGELFASCSPGLTHQVVLTNLLVPIWIFLKTNPIGTVVHGAGVILSNYSGVIPDLIFFSHDVRDTLVKNDRVHGPPSLVVEILPEYWIIDLKNSAVERYVNEGSSLTLQETLREDETLTTPALPGFSCRITEIFSHF